MDSHAPDSAPAALTDLIAAGLVSHEVIGDPGRLGAEAASLQALCRLIAGPVWRIGPFHYAFRARGDDLEGRLGATPPADWTAALEAALQAELGADAVWASPVDLLAATESDLDPDLDQPLLLLRSQAEAVEGALAAAPAGLQAVVQAGYAAEVARLTAGAAPGGALDARLAAIESRQERLLETLLESRDAPAALAATLERVLARLEAQDDRLRAQAAALEALGERLAGLGLAAPGAFQETLGLALAEFLARLEARPERAEPACVVS